MLVLMTMAHEQDMTFNDFVEDILRRALADVEARAAVEDLNQIREEFGVQPKKNKKNKNKIPRKTLALELAGIVADLEGGEGFDAVCMKTLKRVIKQLSRD
jgi:ribosomal protein S19E (S16A)